MRKIKKQILRQRERLRGNLLRSISHDLRTPLTSILGSSSTILENDDVIDKETRVELLKNIYEDTSWLTHSVENILSMTRIDEGKLDIEKRPEVVDEIIAESILRVKKFANSRDIKTNIPDEIIIVHVDVLLIEQVLVNLIDNAIRHTPKNSKIELTVKKSQIKCYLKLQIMEKEYQMKISVIFLIGFILRISLEILKEEVLVLDWRYVNL